MSTVQVDRSFWTVDNQGTYVERDLHFEHYNWFDRARGNYNEEKKADGYNSAFYEIFDMHELGSEGCDYERYGCQILPEDVVVDLGANIGLFSHRAELRGASAVFSFEPIFSTYMALHLNSGKKTRTFKNAVYSDQRIFEMSIPEMKSNTGGGMVKEKLNSINRHSISDEMVSSIPINSLFEKSMIGKIDFMKMDIEGAELECLSALTDQNLASLRCLAVEIHLNVPGVASFKDEFVGRCHRLGFKTFQNNYMGGQQLTLNVWR
jgi:FkbM family methyltransferase